MTIRTPTIDECCYYGSWNKRSDVFRAFGISAPPHTSLIFAYYIPPPFGNTAYVLFQDKSGTMLEVLVSRVSDGWAAVPTTPESIWRRLVDHNDFDTMDEAGILSLLDTLDVFKKI